MKKVLNVLSTVLFIVIALITVFLLIQRMSGSSPELFGYRFLRVATDSMEPEIMTGDVILVKNTPASELKEGDNVTYVSESGELAGEMITHKLISDPVAAENGGVTTYALQAHGINGDDAPVEYFSDSQLVGKVVGKSAVLTWIFSLFVKEYGLAIFLAPLIIMIGVETYRIIKTVKESKTHDDEDDVGREEEKNDIEDT